MFYGTRSYAPLGLGLVLGLVFCILVPSTTVLPLLQSGFQTYSLCQFPVKGNAKEFVDNSGSWKVQVRETPLLRVPEETTEDLKFVRSRFAATELGIHEKLVVIILGQSSLSVTLNASLGRHVPRIHLFAEQSRIDVDMSALAENLTPYRPNGQHAHVHILNSIFNKSMHENYDWFLFVPDTTYINPFQLMNFIKHRNFGRHVIYGVPDDSDKCLLSAGILMSNPVVRSLIQQRHVCSSIVAASDEKAFETCILRATNISCSKDNGYHWWNTEDNSDGTSALHDRMQLFSATPNFNCSMTVSKLLSDTDITALHDHFIQVEQKRLASEVDTLVEELDKISKSISLSATWPKALPPVVKPPNRYQITYWEYFTESEIFKIEPHQNVYPLIGNDALDVQEVIAVAKKLVSSKRLDLEFMRLRNGYRSFNAMRGMEYILDLEFKDSSNEIVNKRINLCRPIELTQLVPRVPYVKEDTDITLVVPVGSPEDVIPTRAFLVRHLYVCKSSISQMDTRRMRLVIAVRGVSAVNVRRLSNDLTVLKEKCKSMQMETSLLLLKPNVETVVEMVAMDEVIDHYGQQTVYVLLSPYADYQREFFDRVRINSIRHFQVFMPIPFAEFSPRLTFANKIITEGNIDGNKKPDQRQSLEERMREVNENVPPADSLNSIKVHKDYGIFDSNDFSVIAMYGADYVNMRSRMFPRIVDRESVLDLSRMFLGQSDIHVLRAIEPSLKMRYHLRSCPNILTSADFVRCTRSQKQSLGSKAQLANVVFNDLEDLSVFQ
ncbi:hypothetical protein FO519_000620 [Halicephalobus sp. NKZ332]|nr:hypothetical protein FO519_000620 [Halicephalobus sp. NKZ332]